MGVLGVLMNKDGSETIKVKPETKRRLEKLGGYGMSMDRIINGLLEHDYAKFKKQKKTGEAI